MSVIDRRLLDVQLSIEKIANEPDENPTAGIQYIVGSEGTGAFQGIAPNSIASFNGTKWIFAAPSAYSLEVLNIATGQLLRYNGSAWVAAATLQAGKTPLTVSHTLTSSEVTAKSFSLSKAVASGYENSVLLFFSGVAQIAGTDFTASGNTISWESKRLDDIGLVDGDVVLLYYVPAE